MSQMHYYPIAIEFSGDDFAFGVIVPDLPGCFSAGDTLEDAIENAKEAIAGFIQTSLEDGDEIPHRLSVEEHMQNPDYEGFVWYWLEVNITQ